VSTPSPIRARRQPAEEDEALVAVPLVPGDEVEPLRGIARNLGQRAAAGVDRARDLRPVDEHARGDCDGDPGATREQHPALTRAHDRVAKEKRDRAEREMHLARERDRGEGRAGERRPPETAPPCALESPEGRRQKDRDRAEQMAGALLHSVGREREGQPSHEGRSAG
jgi:hypothetical protein